MRRNMLLVHQLLRRVQNSKGVVSTPESMPVPGAKISFTSEEIQYHVGLCHRAGFSVVETLMTRPVCIGLLVR